MYPEPTEWQRIGNQIDAAMIFARADFVNVRGALRIHFLRALMFSPAPLHGAQ